MSGRILVVEGGSHHRIVLRSLLRDTHYKVTYCESLSMARAHILAAGCPDIALIDLGQDREAVLAFVSALGEDPVTANLRVIVLATRGDEVGRIAALRAGADDVLDHAVGGPLLMARMRSLLRARDEVADLGLGPTAQRALGMAEESGEFVPAGRVVIVTQRPDALPDRIARLVARLPGGAVLLDPRQDLSARYSDMLAPDLFLIDSMRSGPPLKPFDDLFGLLSDIRSRPVSRHAATLVVLAENTGDDAAMAYDLGADDLVGDSVCPDELAHRVRALLRRKSRADRRRNQLQSGLRAAITDPLTGLHNRRYAMSELAQIAETARGSQRDFTILMLDIDHFKAVNDVHGHPVGDRVLTEVANRLRGQLRAVDMVARFGGEEFLVALPDTALEPAKRAAERLRRTIEGAAFDIAAPRNGGSPTRLHPIKVTLSIGIAVWSANTENDTTTDALLARADRALYAAKAAGRNTIEVALTAA